MVWVFFGSSVYIALSKSCGFFSTKSVYVSMPFITAFFGSKGGLTALALSYLPGPNKLGRLLNSAASLLVANILISLPYFLPFLSKGSW